ncbi:MAG TPA: hypothetical protein VLE97_06645 [Gaiellaceae bacterium]|nr:hypothetical protein [Gaiellaceae bacterium]
MTDDIKLLPEVTALSYEDLKAYARKRAERVARETPGVPEDAAWDDPEEWMTDAAQLAHAVVLLLRPRRVQCPTCRGHKQLCVDDYLQLTAPCPGCRGLGEIEVTP